MNYIKLFEDWSIGYTFRDEGIKVVDISVYQNSAYPVLSKDKFNSFEKKLLNNFVKNNREFVSEEIYKIDKWFNLKIKNIEGFPPLELTIISLEGDLFNVRLTYYVKADSKQMYYQCDEIESVIRLLEKILEFVPFFDYASK